MRAPGLILNGAEALEAAVAGGKAAALARLAQAGFPVPPFFVLTGAFLGDADARLAEALAQLGPGPYAVRSSGVQEDGAAASHAGQYLTMLKVAAQDVAAAAIQVRASGAEANVELYRAARGMDDHGGAPSVIVQAMVSPRVAGVAFTADPLTGRRDRMVVSAIAGLGDRLVGGEEDGESYLFDRSSGLVIKAPEADALLSGGDLSALAELAGKVEAAEGRPQDIEWAFDGPKLFLLQARPITTALRAAAIADPGVTVFDNSNIVESYPGVVSPLTFSFAQYAYARVYVAFVRLLGVPRARVEDHRAVFENMLGRIEGRVYYKLDNWYRALALLPGYRLNRGYMETMMGLDAPLPPDVLEGGASSAQTSITGPAAAFEYLRIGKAAIGLVAAALRLPATRRAFEARLNAATGLSEFSLVDALPPSGLAALYRRLEADLLDRWDAPLVNDFLCMIAFGASRRLMQKWLGPEGESLHNAFLIGQGDIISAEPTQRIRRMAEMAAGDPTLVERLSRGEGGAPPALAAEISAYIEKFGDRCAEELKLESATLAEDPAPLYRAIAGAARSSRGSAPERIDAEARISGLLAERPFRRFVALAILRVARNRVRDRENLRFDRTRIFGRARRVFSALGVQFHALGLLDDPRDVFLLTVAECLGAVEGGGVDHDLRALAALRKAEMEAARRLPDPPGRMIVRGAAILADSAASPPAPAPDGAMRQGVGCSAGQARAKARIITDPRGQTLAPGEILVARHTDPGWIALFTNAAAIVVERGSLLSHSAIVARELGIPCVVGVKDATRWAVDGDMLLVDGGLGRVEKLDG